MILRIEEEHGIVGANGGDQQSGFILGIRGRNDHDTRQMREPGFEHLAVLGG